MFKQIIITCNIMFLLFVLIAEIITLKKQIADMPVHIFNAFAIITLISNVILLW